MAIALATDGFVAGLLRATNYTETTNGATANKSSLDPCLDFFALAGAMRDRPEKAADLFMAAFNAEPQTALRTLFYLRDVRGGQGEREVFRACLRRLMPMGQALDRELLNWIPEYGRWDDLFYAGVTPLVAAKVHEQLVIDAREYNDGNAVSLLAKWLPSINTSSRKTRALARELAASLGASPREYRKTLSALRSRIRLLEHDMTANRWSDIDYGKLPGQAHRKHVKAFMRHTPERYAAYQASLERGEAKINAGTVYPYELYDMALRGEPGVDGFWDNLPDTRGRARTRW